MVHRGKNSAPALSVLVITGALCAVAHAVDTSDLNHLINLELNQQSQPNRTVNLEELEASFLKKCSAREANENVKQMQRESGVIEDRLEHLRSGYKPNGFCTVNEQIKTSVYNFANYAKDCLPAKDLKQANLLNSVIKSVDDFFCFKDGDRLLMFLAESGDDCLRNSEESLRRCSRESFGSDFNSTSDFARLLYFFLEENKCLVMDSFWSCSTKEMHKVCKSTAVKILEGVFENIKSASSCDKVNKHSRRDVSEDERKLNTHFRNRCTEQQFQQFKNGVGNLSNCFQLGYQRAHKFPDPKEFCDKDKKSLKGCFYDAVDQISVCFAREEEFLKDFLKSSLKSMLKFVCGDDGRNLKLYFSDNGKDCSKRIIDASAKDDGELEHCLDKVFSPSGNVVKKTDICKALEVAEECTSRYITKTCPGNKRYEQLGRGLIHSLQAPCGCQRVICLNLLVVLFVAFVITKLF